MYPTYQNSCQSNVQKLRDLIILATESGVSQHVSFHLAVEQLSYRWDERKYQHLLRTCLSSDRFPSLLDRIFRNPVTDEELLALEGIYNLGNVEGSGLPVGLSDRALNQHVMIGGASGFGKTSALNALTESIQENGNIHQVFIDAKNQASDFRWLSRYPKTIVVPLSILRINPFASIRNVPRKIIMQYAIEAIADSFGVLDAGQGIVSEMVEKAFERYEIPSFEDVARLILTYKPTGFGRKQGYLDSLYVRIKSIQLSLSQVLDCRQEMFPGLYNSNIVFEVGGLPVFVQGFLIRLIIMKYSLMKMYNPSTSLTHTLTFDEAQAGVFNKTLERIGRVSNIASLVTQCRSYGMGLTVLFQNPTKIIDELIGNCANIISFHLGGLETQRMSMCMGLTPDQANMLNHIPPQYALFKSSFNFTEPVLVKIRHAQFEKITDEDLKVMMKDKWKKLQEYVTPANEVGKQSYKDQRNNISVDDDKYKLSKDEEVFLNDIKARPYAFTEERYQNSNLSRQKAFKCKEKLLRQGFITELRIRFGSRGRQPTILQLSEKAMAYMKIELEKGKGSHEHKNIQKLIAHLCRDLNIRANVEKDNADIAVIIDEKHYAIEVTLHADNVNQNLKRNIKNGFREVWFIVKDNSMLKRVSDKLDTADNCRIILLEDIVLQLKRMM